MNDLAVIVPARNSASTLDWTLLSLLKLAGECRLEIVVVDSLSTDATPEICRRWGVSLMQVEPGNMYRAVNAGMRAARARWLTYVNSDDVVYADGFRELLRLGGEIEAGVAYGSADFIDRTGRYLHSLKAADPREAGSLLRCMVLPFVQPAAIFAARLYEQLNGFDERYGYSADFDFFCRAWLAGVRFGRVRMPVAGFRLTAGQLSSREKRPLLAEGDTIRQRLGFRPRPRDRWALMKWRAQNIPYYAGRLLRYYMLTGGIRVPRATEAPPGVPQRHTPGTA